MTIQNFDLRIINMGSLLAFLFFSFVIVIVVDLAVKRGIRSDISRSSELL